MRTNDDLAELEAELQRFLIEEELYSGTSRGDVAASKVSMILNRIEVLGRVSTGGRMSRQRQAEWEAYFANCHRRSSP